MVEQNGDGAPAWPSVTIVFLVYNRREELRESLRQMLFVSDYPREQVDVIVVDNASTDGSADMVREEFPQAHLMVRDENVGVSGWNEGFAAVRGDYALVLDDDCYLPPDGLRRAVAAAREHDADLVSFKVVSTDDPEHEFTQAYRTGLFTFWGCAALMRRPVLEQLGGYDPEIFVLANELEFTLRFFDHGFRHLHFPEVVAQHMKRIPPPVVDEWGYRTNARHFAYIAGKLLKPRDAAEAFIALVARDLRDGLRLDRVAFKAVPDTVRGFFRGLRRRKPVRNAELSRFYRVNFETFASPWWFSRRGAARDRPQDKDRWEQYFEDRRHLYPAEPETLKF